MSTAFACLERPVRSAKPRQQGLTMVLDKNLGLAGLSDLLDTSAAYIDLVKFGWGTSAIHDAELIRRKCELLHRHGVAVCPGGTLTEIAWLQGKLEPFLEEAKSLGFSCIEVSDGTVTMPHHEKLRIIREAMACGFHVTSEVGSKSSEADQKMGTDERIRQIDAELSVGAWKVILEARESGTLGIFDRDGATRQDRLQPIIHRFGSAPLIIEAPLRSQQTELLMSLGANVSLGNIAPADVTPLETLRQGLRSDTLLHFHAQVNSPPKSVPSWKCISSDPRWPTVGLSPWTGILGLEHAQ